MGKIQFTVEGYMCERCGHQWINRKATMPRVCPKCHSPYWDVPRKQAVAAKKAWAKRRTNEKS